MVTDWIPFRRLMPDSLQIGRMIHVVPHGQELDPQSQGGRCLLREVQHIGRPPRDPIEKLRLYVSHAD